MGNEGGVTTSIARELEREVVGEAAVAGRVTVSNVVGRTGGEAVDFDIDKGEGLQDATVQGLEEEDD